MAHIFDLGSNRRTGRGMFRIASSGRLLDADTNLARLLGFDSRRNFLASEPNIFRLCLSREQEEAIKLHLTRHDLPACLEIDVRCKNGARKHLLIGLREMADAAGESYDCYARELPAGEPCSSNTTLPEATAAVLAAWKCREDVRSDGSSVINSVRSFIVDFNNVFAIISGYAQLAGERVKSDPQLYNMMRQIVVAVERGGELTKKMRVELCGLINVSGEQLITAQTGRDSKEDRR